MSIRQVIVIATVLLSGSHLVSIQAAPGHVAPLQKASIFEVFDGSWTEQGKRKPKPDQNPPRPKPKPGPKDGGDDD